MMYKKVCWVGLGRGERGKCKRGKRMKGRGGRVCESVLK